MNNDKNEQFASDMVNVFGLDTVMKYFVYKAKADMSAKASKNICEQNTYLILDKISGYTKIGKTKDLKTRVQGLSCGNPNLELLFTIDGDVEDELHSLFSSKRVKGEWFSLSHKDINSVRRKYLKQ